MSVRSARYPIGRHPSAKRGGRFEDGEEEMFEKMDFKHGNGRNSRSPRVPVRKEVRRKRPPPRAMKKQVDSYSDDSEEDDSVVSTSSSGSSSTESDEEASSSSSSESEEDEESEEEEDEESEEDLDDNFRGATVYEGAYRETYNRFQDEQFETRSRATMGSSGGQSLAARSVAKAVESTKNKGGSRLSVMANRALQRRKKESPMLQKKLESSDLADVSYKDGATELYKHIENHRWREAAERCRNHDVETKIWVYRKDKRGTKVLWRMLPLHTAVLYRAPVYVILDLIEANPKAVSECDDRKMLPLHMASRVICKEDVLRVLLKNNPETVTAKDSKGRTARDILSEEKDGSDSKVLKKVNNRNRKNLLKVLKEFEMINERISSANSVAHSRFSNRFDDAGSVSGRSRMSGLTQEEYSVHSRFNGSRAGRPYSRGDPHLRDGGSTVGRFDNPSRGRGDSRSRSRGSSVSRSGSRGRYDDRDMSDNRSRYDDRDMSDNRSRYGDRDMSDNRSRYRDSRSRSRSRSGSVPRYGGQGERSESRSPRSPKFPPQHQGRMRDDSDVASRRGPRLPLGRTPTPGRSVSRQSPRGYSGDDDNQSIRSARSSRSARVARKPRVLRDDDTYTPGSTRAPRGPRAQNVHSEVYDDDVSRLTGTDGFSRAARGWEDDDASAAMSRMSRRSKSVQRVTRKPRGPPKAERSERSLDVRPNDVDTPSLGISEINVDDAGEEKKMCDASTVSDNTSRSSLVGENDYPDGPLYGLWKDIENIYPIPPETFSEKLIEEESRIDYERKLAREEAISKIRYYDPPAELRKLLAVIELSSNDAPSLDRKRIPGERAPLPEKGAAARRLNACGALRALAKNAKNRLRLGRTKGVISSLLHALSDKQASTEERARCSNTLMFLCVPRQNTEAICAANPNMLSILIEGVDDPDPRVRYNSCYCIFLLAKVEENRTIIANDDNMMDQLVKVANIEGEGEDDFDDEISVDGSLNQRFANLGSPSGIRQQGAPETNEESDRGCRLSVMKVFLAISKVKDGAFAMVRHTDLMNLLVKISGTMTAEENILCAAVFTNLTRNVENMDALRHVPHLLVTVKRGMNSKNEECRKCACLTLQNLSCDKQIRRKIGETEYNLPALASHSLKSHTPENRLAAFNTIRNLAIEPANMPVILGSSGIAASLMNEAIKKDDGINQYLAADSLAALSQWLDSVADTAMERNEIEIKDRTLASLNVTTWNQWE